MEHKGLLAPQFTNEDAAREYLEKHTWPDGPVCPHCGLVNEAYKLTPKPGSKTRKGLWKCKGCRKQFTVTVKSIFADSHIPLHKWLLAIHLMASSKKGISAHQLMRNLEFGSYQTAWFMCHRIRWALTREPIKQVLDGIVEYDETYIGGKRRYSATHATPMGERPKDHLGPVSDKAAVATVLQRGGLVRSTHVERVTAKTIKPIIAEMVGENAHLITDEGWVSKGFGKMRRHSTVNHSAKEYARREGGEVITTNTVEGFFAILKRGNYGVYHHWSKKYLGQYLREFDWRYNVRKMDDGQRAIAAVKMTSGKRLMLKLPLGRP